METEKEEESSSMSEAQLYRDFVELPIQFFIISLPRFINFLFFNYIYNLFIQFYHELKEISGVHKERYFYKNFCCRNIVWFINPPAPAYR